MAKIVHLAVVDLDFEVVVEVKVAGIMAEAAVVIKPLQYTVCISKTMLSDL